MKINGIQTERSAVPLTKPFKTALRTVTVAESIIVKITTDNGLVGWGEAPPTVVITGESLASIEAAINQTIKPKILNKSLLAYEEVFQILHHALVGNTSARAAVDMALYDLISQNAGLPLYQFLGGYQSEIETDFTVSVNSPYEMGEDAMEYIKRGFSVLKVKVGKDDINTDIERIKEIRKQIGYDYMIRLDANQGWEAKEAVRSIRKMEDMGLDIELIEQPVVSHDVEGLKLVTDSVDTPIMADESVFSPKQAFEVLQKRAADLLNIKLMKAGGIYRAQTINAIAETCGVACMVGSMIETRLGITAAAHFAASKKNITRFDFDAPLMLSNDFVQGGVIYNQNKMKLPDSPGLGITEINLSGGVRVD
ncbi:dipeptide epimerase [Pseudalkalibacillus caeni]|uniref:Dipeptide epimerase n=1 Tax=Exobacillus caeni TaxID=2574798 RepID=A0A5R9F5F4_9BACL|nr:dipeptide epimerase [Pseudalkalibacillus caeni]TLS37566.1 dipeptide epimerase [Pseudalkalibacillus caeni]